MRKRIHPSRIAALACAASAVLASACAPAGKAMPSSPPRADATLFLAGDALLTRVPGERLRREGLRYPFARVRELMRGADAAFLNLETPISLRGTAYAGKPENVTFRADPIAAFALEDAGVDAVSLANNHMNDYGPSALMDTLDYLDLAGISHAGSGADAASARKPALFKAGSWRIGLLSYADPIWSVVGAGETSAGVAHLVREDVLVDIAALRASGNADFVAVSLHWGDELSKEPRSAQTELAHALIDGGADLVIGHHPHVTQAVERYGKGLILYSLGNFVFDMDADQTYDSMACLLRLGSAGLGELRVLPIIISRKTNQPALAAGADARRIADRLVSLSAERGTALAEEGDALVLASGKGGASR